MSLTLVGRAFTWLVADIAARLAVGRIACLC